VTVIETEIKVMKPNFRKRLRGGDVLLGCTIKILSAEISELLSEVGFDWLLIDIQEIPANLGQVQKMLQSAGDRCSCVVRIPFMDNVWVKKILDTGVDGIIISQVNSAEEASQIVSECKYPPQGSRGVGIARAQMYGVRLQEYVEAANERVAVIIQIDDTGGLNNLKSIIQVQGIDAVFFGADDLNDNFRIVGKNKMPEFKKKTSKIQEICNEANVKLGIFGATSESVQLYIDHGVTLITIGSDVSFLRNETRYLLETIKS
jgi:2-keto-3-deoxy-L-rhamnonate aldolase RhmA